jgi:hypothetical protein
MKSKERERAPMLAHLLAGATGMGFDLELAKDYWCGSEEPWNAEQAVRGRLPKLIYLYVASAVIQIGVPAVLLISILGYLGFRAGGGRQDAIFVWIIIAGITLFGVVIGVLIAFFVWLRIGRQRRAMSKNLDP